MNGPAYRTSDLARAAGIHPNTVRLYVDWGVIPPVERSPNGYRLFTQHHLDCLLLARRIYSGDYPGKALREAGKAVIRSAAADNWQEALEDAFRYRDLVRSELERANQAALLLELWAQNTPPSQESKALSIREVSSLLGISRDVLRSWERNGLINIPRNPHNNYRIFGEAEIERLQIIRMLSTAGYSQMAILRMFLELDSGRTSNLRQALDTPPPDEDVFMASDRWLSTLHEQENLVHGVIEMIADLIAGLHSAGE